MFRKHWSEELEEYYNLQRNVVFTPKKEKKSDKQKK